MRVCEQDNVGDVQGARMFEEEDEVEQLGLMESGGKKVAGSFSADSGAYDSPQSPTRSWIEQDLSTPMLLDRDNRAIE